MFSLHLCVSVCASQCQYIHSQQDMDKKKRFKKKEKNVYVEQVAPIREIKHTIHIKIK